MNGKCQLSALMAILAAIIANCAIEGRHSPLTSPVVDSSSEESKLESYSKRHNEQYKSSSSEESTSTLTSPSHSNERYGFGVYYDGSGALSKDVFNDGHYFNGRNYNMGSRARLLIPSSYDESSTMTSKLTSKNRQRSSNHRSTSIVTSGLSKDYNWYASLPADNKPISQYSVTPSSEGRFHKNSPVDFYTENAIKYNERNNPDRFKVYTSTSRYPQEYSGSGHSSATNLDKYQYDFTQAVAKSNQKSLDGQLSYRNDHTGSLSDYRTDKMIEGGLKIKQYDSLVGVGKSSSNFKTGSSSSSAKAYENKYYEVNPSTSKSAEADSRTLKSEMGWMDDGGYKYHYETSNGIKRSEIIYPDGSRQGTTSYISPEGIEIKTSYIADENGYRAIGDHIPQVPDYIVRSLDYIRTHPYVEKDYYTGEFKTPRTPLLPEQYVRGAHTSTKF